MISRKPFWKSSLAITCLFLLQCSPSKETETSTSDPTREWSWDNYPQASELVLQEISGNLRAEERFIFMMPVSGTVTWEEAALSESTLEVGTLLGTINAEEMALKEREIPLIEELFQLQKEQIRDIKIPQKKIALLKELQQLSKEKNLAQRIQENPAMIQTVQELFPNLEVFTAEGQLIIDGLEKALQKEFSYLAEVESSTDWKEIELKEIDLRLKKMELAALQKESLLTMPFTGTFSTNQEISLTDDPAIYAQGTILGVAENKENLIVSVNMTNSPWLGVPAQSLFLKMKVLGQRSPLVAEFWKEELLVINKQEQLQYLFLVPASQHEMALNLLGNRLEGKLHQHLPETAYIIPKLDFYFYFPAFRTLPWDDAFNQHFATSKILAEGVSDVAVTFSSK